MKKYHTSSYRMQTVLLLSLLILGWSCANTGNPEGGPYDTTPPRLVTANPAPRATQVLRGDVVLKFDEFIKLTNQQEKLVISPASKTPARITASGKSVYIHLEDSLLPNTTYSFYFDDAIVDNNEDNPLENFSYTFSTGTQVDTMQLSGVVLDAQTLEPVSGIVVGAHYSTEVSDSTLRKTPFVYVSKTNKQGRFTIRGLRDSVYTVFALNDNDNDRLYNLPAEGLAFSHDKLRTTKLDSIRTDTIRIDSIVRRDTLYRDSLATYQHTYYEPSQFILRHFVNDPKRPDLLKYERIDSILCLLEFATTLDTMPELRSLDYPVEPSDSLFYTSIDNHRLECWLRDQRLIQSDSVRFSISYSKTDSLSKLMEQTDSLVFYRPKSKSEKKSNKPELREPAFNISIKATTGILSETPKDSLYLLTNLPIDSIPEKALLLETTTDSVYNRDTLFIRSHRLNRRRFELDFKRNYGQKYRLTIDSAALHSIYGHSNDSIGYEGKIQSESELGLLELKIAGADSLLRVDLLDKSGVALLSLPTHPLHKLDSTASQTTQDTMLRKFLVTDSLSKDSKPSILPTRSVLFTDLKPDDYYIRAYSDSNQDGQWTTGSYPERLPETMYYSPQTYSVKKAFTTAEVWQVDATPPTSQKPEVLRKVKPEEKRRREDKNIEYYRRIAQKKNKGKK